MADLSFKDYIIGIVNFGVSFGSIYGVNNQADGVNMTSLEGTINSTNANMEVQKNSFLSDNPFMVVGGFVLLSIWGVVKAMFVMPYQIFMILRDGITGVLGIPSIVFDVLTTILFISLIYSGYRIVKLGW
jgi:hypothetical protein